MRLRKNKRRSEAVTPGAVFESTESLDTDSNEQKIEDVKLAKPEKISNMPMRVIRKILDNPNFSFQLMVIILTLASENVQMDRRIEGMTSTVDRVRSIAEVINNTMQSVKVAAEAPKTIRRLLE
jgi:hypothetical protein